MATIEGHLIARTDTADYHFNSSWTLHEPAQQQVWQLATVDLSYVTSSPEVIGSLANVQFLFDGYADINLRASSAHVHFLARILISVPYARTFRLGLVIPRVTGRIARSDIVSLRLVDLPGVKSVVTLADPNQLFDFESAKRDNRFDNFRAFPQLLTASAAGFVISPNADVDALGGELVQRLSIPWILPSSREYRCWTLALVDGRHDPHVGESLYSAARALGIDLVVVERPGHWIGQEQYRSWYKDLLIIDMAVDEGLSDRIVEAIQGSGHKIDGIITLFDPRAAATAKAAEKLGVARAPAVAFEVATDKLRTSLLDGHSAHRVSTLKDAKSLIDGGQASFPLILKPVAGFLSEGVFLVQNFEDLEHAISDIVKLHGKDALMEPYCDGPEVDANFVLADGEILFFEASDDFPTSAEEGPNGTFIEQANVLPSNLPQQELQIIEKSLHQRLLQLGFRDGIFHLEARVQYSKMDYTKVNGILDLERRPASSPASSGAPPPSAWLIEINPRPPGIQSFQATAITYGVDYIGLSLLLAVGDRERAKILAQPFAQRHQYWSQILFVPTPKGGKFDSDDVCAELKERCPDLVPHISVSFCHSKRGDIIPDPLESGQLTWIAYYLVNSRVSRRHLLEVCERVRNETHFTII
ncbi:ATP-grasp domain-containing protein [Bisporella sp. PMI_857]|nr:ATP-grasp domain-containing protein [Bisporella sp. PMI_857]